MTIRYHSVLFGAALLLAVTGCSPEPTDGVIDGSPTPTVGGSTADDAQNRDHVGDPDVKIDDFDAKDDDLDVVVEKEVD